MQYNTDLSICKADMQVLSACSLVVLLRKSTRCPEHPPSLSQREPSSELVSQPPNRRGAQLTSPQGKCSLPQSGRQALGLESSLTVHRSTDGMPPHFHTPLPPRWPLGRTESIRFLRALHTVCISSSATVFTAASEGFKLCVRTLCPVSL